MLPSTYQHGVCVPAIKSIVSKAVLCDQMISGAGRSRCVRFLFYFRDIAKRHFRVHMGAAAVSGAKKVQKTW